MSHHPGDGRIQLFASPLAEREDQSSDYTVGKNAIVRERESSTSTPPSPPEHLPYLNHDESLHANPAFRRHAEATAAELFFDLFFVANLTTFTHIHEINTSATLKSYVGFFSILWFTWYQVSLHDLRFSVDSIFERICKGLHFGFMVGFAVAGTNFKPEDELDNYEYFQDLSLLLMASRFVLVFQYAAALYFTHHYHRVRVPLAMMILNYVVAAFAYLGLYFAFKSGSTGPHAYIGWYVIAGVETIFTTVVSSVWRLVSFKGTHMLQRMSLLTLIILGEGVIGLTGSITNIVRNYDNFSSSVIGDIVAAILVIYFIFLIYFHRMQDHHIGTFRQQLWSFLHFPFHVALVLALEGSQQFTLWRQGVQLFTDLTDQFSEALGPFDLSQPLSAEDYQNITESLNRIGNYTFYWSPVGLDITTYEDNFQNYLNIFNTTSQEIAEQTSNATDKLVNAATNILSVLSDAVFAEIGIAVEEEDNSEENLDELEDSVSNPQWVNLFQLVYMYTFITSGLVLMLIGALGLVSHTPKTVGGYIRAAVTFAVGLGVTLLSTMVLTDNIANYVFSAWMLPTLTFAYFIVVITDNIRRR
ncbi:hypothetical protein EV356DRAFT_532972 [Viridothelium virens]|uniref:Low temperature requirement A n=1 Tax=Viridothelium virens TaxID=1048519 RepID=A0A6A6H9C8_VIRVR|nr:hypothetical protein EV356DRAFT_532972 [Viridothelium virens]